ncbi:tRNA uridine-5-carboxymethylaminomethyl(34) synthesis enzyme MnmG [Candidatus Riflebacteria bacterium]
MDDWTLEDNHYDVIVIGAGHSGCEAALVCAKMGVRTLLLTLDTNFIASMPCNPSIGGPGKGHLVRELACLGGAMPSIIDSSLIQLRMLNESRGPAVRALRAQADKVAYSQCMKWVLENQKNLELRQAEVKEILLDGKGSVAGIKTHNNQKIYCKKVIVCTGVYLDSRIIIGENSFPGSPSSQRASKMLSKGLCQVGFSLHRLQTATPPRVLRSSIDFTGLKVLAGNKDIYGFSIPQKKFKNQVACFLTETNSKTMNILSENLHLSPLRVGNITDSGPKHCPSIDRKFINFPDKTVHHIFLEPEGLESSEIYLQGLTTALPAKVQEEIVHSVCGLENAHILRYGYAIEYAAVASTEIKLTLEYLKIKGLYTAGQINGTSGYEEAAVQGFMAGINAALSIRGDQPFMLSRTESYIGVLLDDLTRKMHKDPYRITPSRAEFRLQLRMDNAFERLLKYGLAFGLVKESEARDVQQRFCRVREEIENLKEVKINPTKKTMASLVAFSERKLKKQISILELLSRPSMTYTRLLQIFPHLELKLKKPDDISLLEDEIKYSGYVERQRRLMEQVRFYDNLVFPDKLKKPPFLDTELYEFICMRKPFSMGHLMRIRKISSRELIILTDFLRKQKCSTVAG